MTNTVHSDIFFPFGTDVGDSIVPVADDGSSPAINIPDGFPFHIVCRSAVYVSRLLLPYISVHLIIMTFLRRDLP